jgi:uncharacterized protein (TIGR03435 family)
LLRIIRFAFAMVVVAPGASGQSTAPVFEVASVKVHAEPPRTIGVKTVGSRLIADAETVRGLIMWAYNLQNYQVAGLGPQSAVGDTFFDIVAKTEGEKAPSEREFREMLQALLADRFKLKLHREMREMPVYVLLEDKRGSKLKPSAPDAVTGGWLRTVGRNYEFTVAKATINDILTGITASQIDRPVVDRTGLTGTYDLKLVYTPETRANRTSEPDPSDINIFTAVQNQLGLKLEPQKASIEMLVVDHVERPSEN